MRGKKGLGGRYVTAVAVFVATLSTAMATARPPEAADPGTPPPALEQALRAYNAATARNDTATLAALVSNDYMLVNSDASIQGKRSYLADFAVPGFRIDPYEIKRPVYKVFGDAALTAGEIELHWTQDGRRQSRRVRIAHVWSIQQGHWRIAYTQLTRLPDEPPDIL